MAKTFFDNTMIKKMRNNEPMSAAWGHLGSNLSAEIIAEAGFDAIVIDMEHAPMDLPSLVSCIQATKGTDCAPIVRAPWNDMVWIKQILDAGAYGVHVPYVSTKEETEYAVKSCKYATWGFRGLATSQRAVNYGLSKAEYFERANDDVMVMIAIETPEGVANIDEICAVEGVDAIFIGPSDLSTSMGHFLNPSHPEVQEAIAKVEASAKKAGKALGTIAPNIEAAKKLYDRGYTIVYFASDSTSLSAYMKGQVDEFKKYIESK